VRDRRADGGPVSDHLPVVVDVLPPATDDPLPPPQLPWTRARGVATRLPPPPGALRGAALAALRADGTAAREALTQAAGG
jgi:hypothetical protein